MLTRLAGMPGVAVNSSRGAIQVAGCDGATIVGHVPVATDVLDAIQRAATNQLSTGSWQPVDKIPRHSSDDASGLAASPHLSAL